MEALLANAAEFGPQWLLVFCIVLLLWHFGSKYMEIYASRVESQTKLETEREIRKKSEADARIEHDREMAEIKGQMVAAMNDSNTLMSALKTLMESLKTLMESVSVSNEALHNDLKESQAGSRQMQSDVKDMKSKVDVIYAKEM